MTQVGYETLNKIGCYLVNLLYFLILVESIIDFYTSIRPTHFIIPCSAFIGIQVLILLIHRRIPTKQDLKNMLLPHFLMLFQCIFLIMDFVGYFQFVKLQIYGRMSNILIEYMMIQNISKIIQEGYNCSDDFFRELLRDNSGFVLYEVLLLVISSTAQFLLYGQFWYSGLMIFSVVAFLVAAIIQFIYEFGIWKIVTQNIPHL